MLYNFSTLNVLLIFFFTTIIGSALSSIAGFLSIGSYFHNIKYLAIALSIKTFSGFIFSSYATRIIKYLGIKKSIIASQILGLFSLLILASGFGFKNYFIVLLGMILTCIPTVLVTILLSIIFRLETSNDNLFRKYSSFRELIAGVAGILAAMIAPLILMDFNLNFIFIIDGVSYVISIILLRNLRLTTNKLPLDSKKSSLPIRMNFLKLSTLIFILQTSTSLILLGLIPLIASTPNIALTQSLSPLIREWLWSIDNFAVIAASIIYITCAHIIKKQWMNPVLALNSSWLIILVFFSDSYCIPIIIALVMTLTQVSFQRFRDDYVISAGNNLELIQSYSMIASAQKNFVYFLSPLLLGIILCLPMKFSIICVFSVQIVLYLTFIMVNAYSKKLKFLIKENNYTQCNAPH